MIFSTFHSTTTATKGNFGNSLSWIAFVKATQIWWNTNIFRISKKPRCQMLFTHAFVCFDALCKYIGDNQYSVAKVITSKMQSIEVHVCVKDIEKQKINTVLIGNSSLFSVFPHIRIWSSAIFLNTKFCFLLACKLTSTPICDSQFLMHEISNWLFAYIARHIKHLT